MPVATIGFGLGATDRAAVVVTGLVETGAVIAYNNNPLGLTNAGVQTLTGIDIAGPNVRNITDPVSQTVQSDVSLTRSDAARAGRRFLGRLGRLAPGVVRRAPEGPEGISADQMSLSVEGVVDARVSCEESLG